MLNQLPPVVGCGETGPKDGYLVLLQGSSLHPKVRD